MRNLSRYVVAVITTCGLLAAGLSCAKKVTKHVEPPGVRLYIGDQITENIYVFDAISHELVDSLPDQSPLHMTISQDGQYIYTYDYRAAGGNHMKKLAASPLGEVARLPIKAVPVLVESGQLLLVADFDTLRYVDPVSFQVIDKDTITLLPIFGSDTVGFVLGSDMDHRLIAYDYRRKMVITSEQKSLPDGAKLRSFWLGLHPSGTEGYGLFKDSYSRSWFITFQTPSLELRNLYQIVLPYGQIAVSPDGRYVLFHDPGNVMLEYPVGNFYVYDIGTEQVVRIVDMDTVTMAGVFGSNTSFMDFSPDGAKAYISTGDWGSGPVLIFDMDRLAFMDRIDCPYGCGKWLPDPMVVGPEP